MGVDVGTDLKVCPYSVVFGGDFRVKTLDIKITGLIIFLGLVLSFSGCTLQGDSEPLITVEPESAVVRFGETKQFTVFRPADATVTWSVDDILGGNEGTVGTIDSTGLYTAPPDDEDAPERVRIRAKDQSGSSGPATAFLTTFDSNTRISTNYAKMAGRADTYSAGQRGIAVYKDPDDPDDGDIHVYIVWADNSKGGSRIWFTKSDDGGETFNTPELVDEGSSLQQLSPSIAVDGDGIVYVVWEDDRELDRDIYINKYDGSDFGTTHKVNSGLDFITDYNSTPSIAIDSLGNIYVVWEYKEAGADDNFPWLYFAKSSNQGQTFSTPTRIAPGNSGRRPAIAIDSFRDAYVVWEDITFFPSSPTNIKISKIEDDTPGTPQTISTYQSSNYHARFPSVAIGPGGRVYVVWQRALILNPGFDGEIISTYNFDLAKVNQTTLIADIRTPSFPDNQNVGVFGGKAYPSIAGDTDYIYIAWDDQRNNSKDIYFAKSNDGINFSQERIVNDSTGTWHEKPSIAVSDEKPYVGKPYVIWTDHRNTSTVTTISPNNVYFSKED